MDSMRQPDNELEHAGSEERLTGQGGQLEDSSGVSGGAMFLSDADPAACELEKLRRLLFRKELCALETLSKRFNDRRSHAEDLSAVIVEALLIRARKDNRLASALEPVLGEVFSNILKKRPHEMAHEIFPLMGSAIRRSIAETFHTMLLNFQKQIEISFSWRGLRWRLEALRTGRSFSEVVLLHTIVYRVEQIFFIHSQTGLVLSHRANEGLRTQDADLVSAMLTAVQDFVRDCLAAGKDGDTELSSMAFADGVILVEKHPYASLACIVRGTPPAGFREDLASVLDMLLIKYADELAVFSGDTGTFEDAGPYLESCLISHSTGGESTLSAWVKAIPAVLLLAVALVAGGGFFTRYQSEKAYAERSAVLTKEIEQLRSSAGITILEVKENREGPWDVYCLKDMLAPSPDEYLMQAGGGNAEIIFHVTPVVSYAPEVVVSRVLQSTKPPETIAVSLTPDGVLHFSGVASTGWQLQARTKAMGLAGVNGVDMGQVFDPRASELKKLTRLIESTVIVFPFNKSLPVGAEQQKLVDAVNALVELERLAKSMGMTVTLTVYGHADKVGTDKSNYEISQARATTIASMLYSQGSSIPLALYAMGSEHAKDGQREDEPGDLASRRVELRVHLQQAVEPQFSMLEER